MFWHGPLGRAFLRRNLICKEVVNTIFVPFQTAIFIYFFLYRTTFSRRNSIILESNRYSGDY